MEACENKGKVRWYLAMCYYNKTNNNTNFNNTYLILSGSEETSPWMGYDGFQ